MDDRDRKAFLDLLQSTAGYYERKLALPAFEIYWNGLRRFDLEQVRSAISAHTADPQHGQYMPKISDIVAALQSMQPSDGRPGADEAWAIAIPARDESKTVVWTDEISAAWFACAVPLLDAGDKIAARKAFQDRYAVEVSESRSAGKPVRWTPTYGGNPDRRRAAILAAEQLGRLSTSQAAKLLPHEPIEPSATLQALAMQAPDTETARKAIADLRKLLNQGAR